MAVLGLCRMKDCYLLREQESNLQWQRIQSPRCYHQWTSRIIRLWQQPHCVFAPRPRLERGRCPDPKSGGSANSPSGEYHDAVGGLPHEVIELHIFYRHSFMESKLFSVKELEAEAGFEPLMRV